MLKEIKHLVLGQTNCYILSDENKNCVIFDPDGNGDEAVDYIKKNKLNVKYIMLTHGHMDHIGAVEALRKYYNVEVCCGEFERELLLNPQENLSLYFGNPVSLKADKFLKDGETFTVDGLEFKIIYTPGHTIGSICYLIDKYIVSGDTLFMGSCGRYDLPTGNSSMMTQSLKKLASLEGDYTVLPGHGPSTTLEHERICNPYM